MTSENDLPVSSGPVEDTPLSNAQGEEAIGNLLDSALATDLATEVSAQEPDAQQSLPANGDEDDDGLVIDVEEDGTEADAPEETEFKGGRFASDDAKVTLEDGSTISVAELKRNNLFQKDYSKKTNELTDQRKQFDQERSQFSEHINSVVQQREIILALANELIPQEPAAPDDPNDPMAELDYSRKKREWDHRMSRLHGLMQAKVQDQQTATQAQMRAEAERLFEAMPRLKDEGKRKAFLTEAAEIGGSTYGLSKQEIEGIADHRYVRILADAIAYRKAVAKRDAGQKQPATQPRQPRIPPQQRMSQQTPQQRDSKNAFDRLRNSGTARDAEAALMQFLK